jgi:hypothetical protein
MKAKRRESAAPRTGKQTRGAVKHRKPSLASVRREFHQEYPSLPIDDDVLKLVGIDPPLDLRSEKRALRVAVTKANLT